MTRTSLLCTLGVALAALTGPVWAQQPSVKIGTAALLAPGTANGYYGSSTTSTVSVAGAGTPKEIVELARALNSNVDLIYEFVRNNVETNWMYGLQKGALGTLIDRSGTAFDQAKLMGDLLRQAGYTASYVEGTITLDGAEFQAWTGITSAMAACQLLSSGGIPAAINGSTLSDCGYAASPVSSVQLSHIWVSVVISGSNYVFDPSYKPHTFNPGAPNLWTAAGISPGTTLTQASSGMESAPDAATGVNYIRNINVENLYQPANPTLGLLPSYANTLLTYIQNTLPTGGIEDLVGGSEIIWFETEEGGLRQTQLPYATAPSPTVQHTWSGNIPDQYRTSLNVVITKARPDASFPQIVNRLLYVDEVYGRKLTLSTDFIPLGTSTTFWLKVLDETGQGQTLDTGTYSDNPGYSLGTITLTANHPYAAAADGSTTLSGNYMDVTVAKGVTYATPLTILHGWGDTGRGLVDKWGARKDQAMPHIFTPGCETCGQHYPASKGDSRREQLAASWLAQSSHAARLHATIAKSIHTHHHSVGVVAADAVVDTMNINPGGPPDYRFTVSESFDRIDVETAFSLTSKSANAVDRRAAVHAIAEATEALEGSVAAQNADLPDTVSTATRFEWGNRPPVSEDPSIPAGGSVGPRRFYTFTDINAPPADCLNFPTPICDLIKAEGQLTTSNDGIHGGADAEIGQLEFQSRRGALQGAIRSYALAGFSVVASEEGFLGPGQRGGAFEQQGSPTVFMHQYSKQRGGSIVATRYVGGEPVEIAHIAIGPDANAKGGGGGAQTTHQAQYDPSKAADILKARFVDRSKVLGVDLQSGELTTTSPASITVGNGGFPYELSAQLIWRGGDIKDSDFGPVTHIEPQTPWTTNWNNTLTVSGSAFEAMGESDVRAAVGTVAAFLAAQDVYKATQSTQREVVGALIGAWWVRQLSGNVVTASVGADTRQFVKLYNGQWIAPGAGPHASLAQTGNRAVFTQPSCTGTGPSYVTTRGWNYAGVSFQVTNAQGDVQTFPYWNKDYNSGGDFCATLHGFRLSTWTFPYSNTPFTITLVYGSGLSYQLDELIEVNNSLGRKITFIESGRGGFTNGLTGGDLRSVTVTYPGSSYDGDAEHTDPSGAVTKYAAALVADKHLLTHVYAADNGSVPSLQYDYDTLRRVKEARDAVALQIGGRAPYQFLLADGARGERIDPAGGAYVVYFDRRKHARVFFDELERPTAVEYDGRGRVEVYTYPEGDSESFEYDDHNNPKKFTRTPKPDSLLSPIVITADWNQTWNKPNWIRDPMHTGSDPRQTDFVYFSSGNGKSLIQTVTRPAAGGTTPRPVYEFTYNSRGQVLDARDPTGLILRSTYHATNGNRLATILNPGGVNATTTFGYDLIGNMTSIQDPRNNVAENLYDNNRRVTVVKHHNGLIGATVIAAERSTYDVLGRVTKEEGGTAFSGTNVTAWQMRKEVTYTPTSKVDTEKNGASELSNYDYDPMDRVLESADPLNRRTRMVYDLAGQTLCEWRGWDGSFPTPSQPCDWNHTTYPSTGAGKIRYAKYTYSENGQRLSVKDANNNLSEMVYDDLDRLIQLKFPMPTTGADASNPDNDELYEYDPNGNRISLTKRDNELILFEYDKLNRLSKKNLPNTTTNDVYTIYDLAGRPTSVRFGSTSGQGVIYGFDSAKRVTSEASFGRTMSFQYDAASNRHRVTWPNSAYVSYSFDALNRMTEVRENSATVGVNVLGTHGYDSFSRRISLGRTNSTLSTWNYDSASRLLSLGQDFSGSTQDLSLGFGYTLASQLSARSSTNSLFDWTAQLPDKTYAVNGLNQYTTVSGTTIGHDPNGNLTSDGSRTFAYDVENRLTTVSGGASLTLTYDPLGRLRQSTSGGTTTELLYDDDRLVAEYTTGGTLLRRYVHGPGVDDPMLWYEGSGTTNKRYLHVDERGTVIATSLSTGVATPYYYGPYGEPTSWTGSRFRYTGQIALPEVSLYSYKARVYDPVLGRFLQSDPVGYEDDLNLYSYVGNDPVNFFDRTGTSKQWVGWLVRLSGEKMILVARVTKEQAVRLRRKGENFKGRFRQKSHEVEVAAHGEQNLMRHGAHEAGYRPHYQTEGVPGHSFWTAAGAALLVAADVASRTAEATEQIASTLEENADLIGEIANLSSPATAVKEITDADKAAYASAFGRGAGAEDSSDTDKEKGERQDKVICTGSRIPSSDCW